ncbi:uncharacterized protein LTHEOB_12816 [Lasiodiplodia theobromae]|uniref:uncharacterized protein n=1 Tax=Lasiodiplodia theobromae TaxID=45133 RepID=UPI0015C3B141|nr:uncharacterized protein LTHEOB_12816 [Lasiodiplodia theobromae]KAF4535127.1 hypothetical protein LTHEOB_12816 [Lasiodiplodia theobromae]
MEEHKIEANQKCMHCLMPYHDGGPFFCKRKCVFCGKMGHNGVICDMILPHFRAYTEENEKEKNALRTEVEKKDKEIAQLRSLLQEKEQMLAEAGNKLQQQQQLQDQQQYHQQDHQQQEYYQDDTEDWRLKGFDTSNDSLYSLHGWQPLEQVLQPDDSTKVVFEDFVNDE